MNDIIMNTYIYTTRDVAEALKNNGITKNTMQISQYIRDNNFDERGMAFKNREQIPGLNETHEVWRISMYGMNEIIKHFLDERRLKEKKKEYHIKINQIVKKYKNEYLFCNYSSISTFIQQNKYVERGLAIKEHWGKNGKYLISQEGVDEMFEKLFEKKQKGPIENNGKYIYGFKDIATNVRKRSLLPSNPELRILLEKLETEGLAKKVPTRSGRFDPRRKNQFRWRIGTEGLKRINEMLPPRYMEIKEEDYGQITIPVKGATETLTTSNEDSSRSIRIEIEKKLFNYLLILENVTDKTKEQICTEIIEKQIEKSQEEISKILNT